MTSIYDQQKIESLERTVLDQAAVINELRDQIADLKGSLDFHGIRWD